MGKKKRRMEKNTKKCLITVIVEKEMPKKEATSTDLKEALKQKVSAELEGLVDKFLIRKVRLKKSLRRKDTVEK